MSREELDQERRAAEERLKEIEKAQAEYQGRRIKELRSEIDALLEREGLTLDDVYGGRQSKPRGATTRSKGPAKYRHPENPEKTWSGRGRQPDWYKAAIADGVSPEDMRI